MFLQNKTNVFKRRRGKEDNSGIYIAGYIYLYAVKVTGYTWTEMSSYYKLLLQAKVRNAKMSGNLDAPEGGLDAVMQAITCEVCLSIMM